jgi:hypothetical protein
MLRIGFYSFLLLCVASNLQAQSDSYSSAIRLAFNSVDFGSISFSHQLSPISIHDFKSLMLSPKLDYIDPAAFEQNNFQSRFVTTEMHLAVGFHLIENNKHMKGNPLLRFGIGYYQTNLNYGYYSANSITTVDSMSVPGSSALRPVDSVFSGSLSLFSSSSFLTLSSSILWQTNPEKRFCLYGGIGMGFGLSTKSSVDYDYRASSSKIVRNTNGSVYQEFDRVSESDWGWTEAKPWQYVSFNALAGLDFRLGNSDKFWKYLHWFFEIGPNFQILSAQQLTPFNNSGLWMSFGWRFRMIDFAKPKTRLSSKYGLK